MSFSRFLLRLALGRRLPTASGELRLSGPGAPVTIRRDAWGVPHIDAANEADAHFACGFCQGQDRAGQLEVMWRLARGRLAEWVGAVALPADRAARRIGFRRAAEKQLAVLSDHVRGGFERFAAGVNAGATVGLPEKPHEFALVGGAFSPWDAADVLALLKLQSFLLPSNWDAELARLRIVLADGPEAMRAVDPLGGEPNPPSFPGKEGGGADSNVPSRSSTAPDVGNHSPRLDSSSGAPPPSFPGKGDGGLGSALARLTADLAALQKYLPRGGGSNNWLVAGSRTASGKPLLASDPHLAPTCPPPWYLIHVRTPEWEVAGAALAGAPGVAIGHNGFCAWGVTAGLTDNSDLFVETLGPDRRSVREADGSFRPCEVVREVIRVRGAADAVEDVLVTPRGPVLTPLEPAAPVALSLSAVWLEARPLVGFFGAPAARLFDEFRQHFAAWPALPLNVLYADVTGATGWQLVGEVPVRRGGNGLLPRPADRPDSGWSGMVPFEQMPFVADPACGYFGTANDDVRCREEPTPQPPPCREGEPEPPRPDFAIELLSSCSPSLQGGGWGVGSSPWLGADFIDDYRARRIREALAARDGWTAADCAALQLDTSSIPWREMKGDVLTLTPTDSDARDALKLLAEWNGHVDTDSPAAAVFELFVAEMCMRVAKAKAPTAWRAALGEGGIGVLTHNLFADRRVAHLVRLLRERPAGWFASWPAEMEAALAEVVKLLRKAAGPGPGFWAWGHLRQLRLEHPLFGKHKWLGPAFNRGPVPWGGDQNTVSQAGAKPTDPTDFTHNMANLRCVFDLADLSKSTYVMAGGQSGNPLSPHHADQLPLWQRGESFVMPWDQADVIRAAVDTLRLLPLQVGSS